MAVFEIIVTYFQLPKSCLPVCTLLLQAGAQLNAMAVGVEVYDWGVPAWLTAS